jgi:hypothetical protein
MWASSPSIFGSPTSHSTALSPSLVPSLALTSYSQRKDRVDVRHESVQGDVPARALPDDELTLGFSRNEQLCPTLVSDTVELIV